MKKMVLLLCSLSMAGCAHKRAEDKIVHFPYAPELLKSIQAQVPSRHPASMTLEAIEEKSTRRVYFTTLYHQHLVIGAHLRKTSAINSCPQFHHDKIEADAYGVPEISLYGAKHIEDDGKNYFPELVFNKKFSLSDYHLSLQGELETLCEEGLSDNFYKFDNLITHHAKRTDFHMKPDAMESVLKIPIFANFYLIKMIEARHELALNHPQEKLFIRMSETHWFDRYVSTASRMRGNFLRNKMVRR
ncbi:MAG TPA: hypothetical protein VNJ08_04665 [Bacteriovoracaceae bacterium]|nr:hypothetical protein [Bacteriovoracaceae bacterium]